RTSSRARTARRAARGGRDGRSADAGGRLLAGHQLAPGVAGQLHEDVDAAAGPDAAPHLAEADLPEGRLGALVVAERLEPHEVEAEVREREPEQSAHGLGPVAARPVRLLADDDAQRRRAAAHVVELRGADELVTLVEDPERLPVGALGVGLEQALQEPQRHAVRRRAVEVGDLGVAEVALQPAPVLLGELVERAQRDPAAGRSHGQSLLAGRAAGTTCTYTPA